LGLFVYCVFSGCINDLNGLNSAFCSAGTSLYVLYLSVQFGQNNAFFLLGITVYSLAARRAPYQTRQPHWRRAPIWAKEKRKSRHTPKIRFVPATLAARSVLIRSVPDAPATLAARRAPYQTRQPHWRRAPIWAKEKRKSRHTPKIRFV